MKLNMLIGTMEICSKRKLVLIKNSTYDNYCNDIFIPNVIRHHERNTVVQILNTY